MSKKSNNGVRDKVVSIRVNEDEYKLFKEGADAVNRTIADYVRNLVIVEIQKERMKRFREDIF